MEVSTNVLWDAVFVKRQLHARLLWPDSRSLMALLAPAPMQIVWPAVRVRQSARAVFKDTLFQTELVLPAEATVNLARQMELEIVIVDNAITATLS